MGDSPDPEPTGETMAKSHYCNGKWRDGALADCDRHDKLSSKQTTVHRGAGTPGGFSGKQPKSKPSGGSKSSGSSSSG